MSQKIRIKLKSYDYSLVDKSAEKIVKTVKATGAVVSGPIPLPTHRCSASGRRQAKMHLLSASSPGMAAAMQKIFPAIWPSGNTATAYLPDRYSRKITVFRSGKNDLLAQIEKQYSTEFFPD